MIPQLKELRESDNKPGAGVHCGFMDVVLNLERAVERTPLDAPPGHWGPFEEDNKRLKEQCNRLAMDLATLREENKDLRADSQRYHDNWRRLEDEKDQKVSEFIRARNKESGFD